jgi:hypothetical protein
LRDEVDVNEAETLRIARRPFEIVEQRPHKIATDVSSRRERLLQRIGIGLKIGDPPAVVDETCVVRFVVGGRSVLQYLNRQAEAAIYIQQGIAKGAGHDRPSD